MMSCALRAVQDVRSERARMVRPADDGSLSWRRDRDRDRDRGNGDRAHGDRDRGREPRDADRDPKDTGGARDKERAPDAPEGRREGEAARGAASGDRDRTAADRDRGRDGDRDRDRDGGREREDRGGARRDDRNRGGERERDRERGGDRGAGGREGGRNAVRGREGYGGRDRDRDRDRERGPREGDRPSREQAAALQKVRRDGRGASRGGGFVFVGTCFTSLAWATGLWRQDLVCAEARRANGFRHVGDHPGDAARGVPLGTPNAYRGGRTQSKCTSNAAPAHPYPSPAMLPRPVLRSCCSCRLYTV